jgi:uncharacterized cupin superfamily protein
LARRGERDRQFSACFTPITLRASRRGTGDAHHLVNETQEDAVFLEMGDRTPGDAASYPDDDLSVKLVAGAWHFARKDGSPF